ncbi:hypothetical protein LP416_17570 [Polaromonas sp. P2-4]|nr:hypothetical protein LP416_17570 [Polaromonas sp. P2-4]
MTLTRPSHHDQLLGHLYDAVMAPKGFQSFIEKLVEVFQLKGVTMTTRHLATHEVKGLWFCGMTQAWLESYSLDYARRHAGAAHHELSDRPFLCQQSRCAAP